MVIGDIKFVCLSFSLCVCLFGKHLVQNCRTYLAEILHRDGLSHTEFWILVVIAPRVPPRGSRKYIMLCRF